MTIASLFFTYVAKGIEQTDDDSELAFTAAMTIASLFFISVEKGVDQTDEDTEIFFPPP